MGINGVVGVMIGTNFVTVTKGENGEWDEMNDEVMSTLDGHLGSDEHRGQPRGARAARRAGLRQRHRGEDPRDPRQRDPARGREDGGDITLDRFDDGIVYLHMKGSCSGLPVLDDDPEDGHRDPAPRGDPRGGRGGGGLRRKVSAAEASGESCCPDQSPELLRELHLLTREGNLNADALRKLKQVNHLVGLLQPALDDIFERFGQPVVVDVGSGNAYLGLRALRAVLQGRREGRAAAASSAGPS